MKILVSACLLGVGCRYDGKNKENTDVLRLMERHTLIPICPEILGGLTTPRPPAERQGKRVINDRGADVTAAYRRGAEEVLRLCRLYGCEVAILKQRSPACGSREIYDGSFRGQLRPGDGVLAQLLKENGIRVLDETETEELL